MTVELETRGEEVAAGWRDQDGFVTYIRPGHGPRSAPRGEYPTGPDVGTPMPNVSCLDSFGHKNLLKHIGPQVYFPGYRLHLNQVNHREGKLFSPNKTLIRPWQEAIFGPFHSFSRMIFCSL